MSKKQQNESEKNIVELEEMNIILKIPKDTASLEITASMLKDGDVVKVGRELSAHEVFECRKKFLDHLIDDDYDATYEVIEEGRKYLDELGI